MHFTEADRLLNIEEAAKKVRKATNRTDDQDKWLSSLSDLFDALDIKVK